jgi:hypothetical protein
MIVKVLAKKFVVSFREKCLWNVMKIAKIFSITIIFAKAFSKYNIFITKNAIFADKKK